MTLLMTGKKLSKCNTCRKLRDIKEICPHCEATEMKKYFMRDMEDYTDLGLFLHLMDLDSWFVLHAIREYLISGGDYMGDVNEEESKQIIDFIYKLRHEKKHLWKP